MLPRSRYECPRCGFGVRPRDEQCGRCGESMNPTVTKPVEVTFSAVRLNNMKIEECSTMRIRSVEAIPVARPDTTIQFRSDSLERREKALVEKERKLEALAESLKERSQRLESLEEEKAVEQMSERSNMDELRQKVREDLLRQFQPELEALQSQLEVKEAELEEAQLRARMLEAGELIEQPVDQEEMARITEEIFQELRSQVDSPPKVIDAGLIMTKIPKLDKVLGGGIPHGHTILFNGAPGTMKSILTYTILYKAALDDRTKGLYLSLEQSSRSIMRQMEKMGMPLSATEGRLVVADLNGMRESMSEEQGTWRDMILHYVQKMQREMEFKIFVLDSLESFKAITEHSFNRQDLKDLFDWFKSLGITVLVISENTSDEWDESNQGEAYLSDGIIELSMHEMNDSRVQRWIRCVKMRGMNTDPRFFNIFHDGNEFNLSLPLANQPF
ncbi:MAG TPA: ATPase domain-containing protein [Methanomassiliicoccales archaeon]|nr:ATPase domain-containing protein [Methanomassiliicoccales archaeon]